MKGTFASLAQKGRKRERESERARGEGRKKREKKESWQLLGACGVGPFKARSPDARRRNCPPRVAPALLVIPSSPPTLLLRTSTVCFLSAAPDTFLRRAQAGGVANGLYEISSTSHLPFPTLPNLFFFPLSLSYPLCCLRSPTLSSSHRGFGERALLLAIFDWRSNELRVKRTSDGILILSI